MVQQQQPVELVLESVGGDYPGLVREALNAKDADTACSASLSSCGYAWMVVGRNLYVWKYETEDDYVGAPAVLNLPPSGLPYNAQTICVYKRQGFSTPGVIAVTREGTVRHWPMLDRPGSDNSIDLDREVALSLTRFSFESFDGIHFLLATTTCSFFLLSINMNIAPTPGKRQRLCSEIIIKVIYKNTRSGIGGKLASAIFGEGRQLGSHLVKALVYEQSDGNVMHQSFKTADSNSVVTGIKNLHILAVTTDHLHSYSMGQSAKVWSCELACLGSEHFAMDLWNLRDVEEHSHWRHEIKVWILDAVNIRNGVLVLFACINRAISMKIYFALGYVSEYDSVHPPTTLEWFCFLKALSNEYKSTDEEVFANISLKLPTNSEQGSHDKVEGVLLVTPKTVYSFRLPDRLLKKAPLKLLLCVSYNATFISSARDARYCYLFLEEKGLQRARSFPKGFDANLTQSIAEMSKIEIHEVNPTGVVADRCILAKAFCHFSKADLIKAGVMVQELLENRHAAIAQICTEYAISMVDDIPDNESWNVAIRQSPHSRHDTSKNSFLFEIQLEEQKKRVMAMFVLFIKNVGLDEKLDRRVITCLSKSRSARSQIVELIEKVGIVIALYKWSKQNSAPIFDAALKRVLSRRKEGSDGEFLLAHKNYVFREVSRIHELLIAMLEEEEEIISGEEKIEIKLECVEYVSTALIVVKEAIDDYREDALLDSGNDLRWTQEKHILTLFIQHLNILFGCAEQAGRGCPKFPVLLKQAISIAAFVMNEQTINERQNSPVVAKFLKIGEQTAAVELAKRFHDYKTILDLASGLADDKRRAKVEEYKEFFNSVDFCNALYEFYQEHGYMKDLLEEIGPEADAFFATRSNIGWMRDIANDAFEKASHTLKILAQDSDSDVIIKKRLLSFAKLAALCEDEVDVNLLEDIKCDLRLIKQQEKIDKNLDQKFGSSDPAPKISARTAEEMIQIHLASPSCNVDHCFEALMTLSNLLNEKASNRKIDLIHSLQTKIWLTAIRLDKDYWEQVKLVDPVIPTVYYDLLNRIIACDKLSKKRKLELFPNIEELIEILTEVSHNETFAILLRGTEEAARKNISNSEWHMLPVRATKPFVATN